MSEEYFNSLTRKDLLRLLDKLDMPNSVAGEWLEERKKKIKEILTKKHNWVGDRIDKL